MNTQKRTAVNFNSWSLKIHFAREAGVGDGKRYRKELLSVGSGSEIKVQELVEIKGEYRAYSRFQSRCRHFESKANVVQNTVFV